jgi:hypothetical protein
MRVSIPCVPPLLALGLGLCCQNGASALESEFSEFRLGLGIVTGFDKEKITGSTLAGSPDTANDRQHELTAKVGFDAQPGLWMGSTVGDDVAIVFGAAMVVRTPSGSYAESRDTGTANGAGTGNVLLNYRERVNAVMFGAKLSGGVGWIVGPARIEVTPFAGVGAIRAHFQESLVHTNDPNNLLTPTDSNASFTNNGGYFEYGLSSGVYFAMPHGLLLGGTAGWQNARAVVHVTQHGPFMDAADRVLLMRNGAFLDIVGVISF